MTMKAQTIVIELGVETRDAMDRFMATVASVGLSMEASTIANEPRSRTAISGPLSSDHSEGTIEVAHNWWYAADGTPDLDLLRSRESTAIWLNIDEEGPALSPAQARALAANLIQVADEIESLADGD